MRRVILLGAMVTLVVCLGGLAVPRVEAQSGDTLSVSTGWALPGGLDTLSVRIKNATVIKGLHFKLVDSPDKLTVVGMAKAARISSFRVDTTSKAGGFWVLMVPDTSTSPRLTAGSGEILQVYVRVAASATGGTNASVGFDSVRAAANATGNPAVSIVPRSGVFWFGRKGDVLYNTVVDLFDVLRMIDITLQRPPTPTAYERWAGDFDDNGIVDVQDIGKAIDLAVSGMPKSARLPEEAPSALSGNIALRPGPTTQDGRRLLTIEVESPVPLAGLQVSIKVTSKGAAPGAPTVCGIANGMSLASKLVGEELNILLYSTSGGAMPAGRGSVAQLTLATGTEEPAGLPLQIVSAHGATLDGERVDLLWDAGPAHQQLPQTFALHQSRPNPFSGATVISYDIPSLPGGAVDVQVAVFNLHGQLVRLLEHARRDAGRYTVQWDGRDEAGNAVSSGVYFYKLLAGEVTLVRKLAILR
ncbi:MAG: T9SS type A sorting domain-containing protein [candidate division KSB1 bacterium]|nr:T9SS type A sorting domain-containing protein [candidate division KSB1 bacterium]